MSDPPTDTLIAGRYAIVRTLGRGAFAHTFLAEDRERGERVALKMLDARRADLKALELFEREAVVLRSLRHHGVPAVHGTVRGRWDDHDATFLVMDYVEGTSLAQIIKDGAHRESAAVLGLFLDLLGILDYLHGLAPPVLHRDIKPANIIVRPDGLPALVDFGAVRRVFKDGGESGSTVVGTHGYMPYEQFMGQASPASDLFALGATMLHLVTGRAPSEFMGDDGRITVPDALPGDARLRLVLERLLRPSPAERFQSARETRHALVSADAVPGHAVVPAAPARGAVTVAGASGALAAALPPGTRALEGPTRELYRRLAWPWYRFADGSNKPAEGTVLSIAWDLAVYGFFSVLTAGVLPAVFLSVAAARRRRLKPFLRDGVPVTATVLAIQLVDLAFGERLARVSYEFIVDGETIRDTDQVLPVIAGRWQPGDRIQLLYLPGGDRDSLIVSGS